MSPAWAASAACGDPDRAVPRRWRTLFVGHLHHELIRTGNNFKAAEVVTMSLTFDHRVVNGGGAAMFMQDLRKAMETFQLPARD
jgi:hypothetical protein